MSPRAASVFGIDAVPQHSPGEEPDQREHAEREDTDPRGESSIPDAAALGSGNRRRREHEAAVSLANNPAKREISAPQATPRRRSSDPTTSAPTITQSRMTAASCTSHVLPVLPL